MASSNLVVLCCSEDLLRGHDFHIVTLRHPKTEKPALFAFSQDYASIAEVLQHKPDYGSWFVGKDVSGDGSMMYLTKFDPLFIIISHLFRQHKINAERYSPLEQILEDENYPHTRKLCRCSSVSSLSSIADVKGADDYRAYRYNEEKTMKWLQKKVERLASHLQQLNVCVQSGSQSTEFVRTKITEATEVEYTRYSCGIVGSYLSNSMGDSLKCHLNLPEEVVPQEPASKRVKTGSSTPSEDYSKGVLTEKQQVSDKKMSATQKKLAKIDKTGMKSITSFFTAKAKKT